MCAGLFVYCQSTGRVLATSRRYDHTKFGTIGGKVDPEDNTIYDAAIREGIEEVGIDFSTYDVKGKFTRKSNGKHSRYIVSTFYIPINKEEDVGTIIPEKGIAAKWVELDEICIKGPYSTYNTEMIKHFGITI